MQVLENPPQLQELLVVGKPLGSKVVLNKDADSLEIIVPATGFRLEMLGLLGFAIAWNSFIFFWTGAVMFAPFPINVPFVLFSLPFWVAGIGMIQAILWGLFGQVQLSLNRQQISLTYNLFGFKHSRLRPARREDITKLEYAQKTFKYNSEGAIVAIKPRISIWVGTHKYELGNSDRSNQSGFNYDILTKPELEWLANELSDWLGMPIIKG